MKLFLFNNYLLLTLGFIPYLHLPEVYTLAPSQNFKDSNWVGNTNIVVVDCCDAWEDLKVRAEND